MIQTVMSFMLYMLKQHLQVFDVLSCDYYSQIFLFPFHAILGIVFMNFG